MLQMSIKSNSALVRLEAVKVNPLLAIKRWPGENFGLVNTCYQTAICNSQNDRQVTVILVIRTLLGSNLTQSQIQCLINQYSRSQLCNSRDNYAIVKSTTTNNAKFQWFMKRKIQWSFYCISLLTIHRMSIHC